THRGLRASGDKIRKPAHRCAGFPVFNSEQVESLLTEGYGKVSVDKVILIGAGVDAAGDVRVRDRRDLNRTFGGDDVHDFLVIKKRYGSAALQIIEVDLSKCTPVFDGRVKNTRSPSGMMSQPSSSDGNTRVTCRFAVAPSPVVEA